MPGARLEPSCCRARRVICGPAPRTNGCLDARDVGASLCGVPASVGPRAETGVGGGSSSCGPSASCTSSVGSGTGAGASVAAVAFGGGGRCGTTRAGSVVVLPSGVCSLTSWSGATLVSQLAQRVEPDVKSPVERVDHLIRRQRRHVAVAARRVNRGSLERARHLFGHVRHR